MESGLIGDAGKRHMSSSGGFSISFDKTDLFNQKRNVLS